MTATDAPPVAAPPAPAPRRLVGPSLRAWAARGLA